MSDDPNVAFTLRIQLYRKEHDARLIIIRAFDDNAHHYGSNHFRIDIEVKHGGKVIFPRGQLWCGVNAMYCTDSNAAKELVMSCVGGWDNEDGVTPEQAAWRSKHGDALACERMDRYCDEDGNPKRGRA